MSNVVTLGLASITFKGSSLGLTYQDSCTVSQDDPETTEFYAEEEDDPIEITERPGAIRANFQVMDPTAALAAKAGTSEEGVLVITPKKGLAITFNRAKVTYKLDGQYGRGGLFLVSVSAIALKPETGNKITVAAVQQSGNT
jgi:hypothetical protein